MESLTHLQRLALALVECDSVSISTTNRSAFLFVEAHAGVWRPYRKLPACELNELERAGLIDIWRDSLKKWRVCATPAGAALLAGELVM